MTATLSWDFPLPRPHCGVPLGNGTLGVLVWGDETLNLTIGRAGFWDRRGGNAFAARTTFAEVKGLLQAGDEAGLKRVFGLDEHEGVARPHQLGCGRLELSFPQGHRPVQASLHTGTGLVRVRLVDGAGRWSELTVRLAMDRELAWVELPEGLPVAVRGRPSYEWIGGLVGPKGVLPPRHEQAETGGGWQQDLPADDPLALRWRRDGRTIAAATALGAGCWERAGATLAGDLAAAGAESLRWWHRAWQDIPIVELPDAQLQHAWDLGAYRWLAATVPGSVACTLQGPWLEDYQIPPWSCDYHFNINAQMIYQPGLRLGRAAHFQPLWDLLRSWMPQLRAAGRAFFRDDEALLLPHAVDDRCQVVGAFWTGMIDHACTGWMGLLAYECWRHDGDRRLLEDLVWPLLLGAHAGYRAMAEERDGRLSLPVSVSPEFKGARMDAWGRDASFQLACWHAVLAALPVAAAALGRPADPAWAATTAKLPRYSTVRASRQRDYPEKQVERIALWQGMDLIESHRHHSHLAGIWPFQTLDPAEPVVRESLWHWTRTGAGSWSGWCVPWAAILCARSGASDGAVAWLHWWKDVFTNVGHGTLHDADFPGHSTLCGDTHIAKEEIFQLDAGMGALSAICELLVQERGGAIHVLPQLPARWRSLRFDGVHLPGGVRVGATVQGGRVAEIRVESRLGGRLRLAHGLARWSDGSATGGVEPIERDFAPGERLVLRAI